MSRLLACTLVSVLLAVPAAGDDKAPPKQPEKTTAKETEAPDGKNPSVWMRKKLDYAQNILKGITTEDFDTIAENARAMRGLGKMEAFARHRNTAYTRQLQMFEDFNDEIIRQADRDNVEGVALAFTQLTVSCVNCHKLLRQHAKLEAEK